MHTWHFVGAVCAFGKVVASKWSAETVATTRQRAISNLKFRFRTQNNIAKTIPLELVGICKTM